MSTYLACLSQPAEIVRTAPVLHALRARGHQAHLLLVGPRTEAIDRLCHFLDTPPAARLAALLQTPGLTAQVGELMIRLDTQLRHFAPDTLVVQGASSCALATALAAAGHELPLAHLDAGERSLSQHCFPEDMNSRLIARTARWHFPGSAQARRHLLQEGIAPDQIHDVGNTAIDAACWAVQRLRHSALPKRVAPDVLRFLREHEHPQLLLVSVQNRAHWGERVQRMGAAVAGLLQMHPQVTVVWPLPRGPQLRGDVHKALACMPAQARHRLCLTEPLDYPALISLLEACRFALTDSQQLQQEASALHKPLLIVSDEAREPALVQAGSAVLSRPLAHKVLDLASELLCDPLLLTAMQQPASPFGDGQAGQRIASVLTRQDQPRHADERQAA